MGIIITTLLTMIIIKFDLHSLTITPHPLTTILQRRALIPPQIIVFPRPNTQLTRRYCLLYNSLSTGVTFLNLNEEAFWNDEKMDCAAQWTNGERGKRESEWSRLYIMQQNQWHERQFEKSAADDGEGRRLCEKDECDWSLYDEWCIAASKRYCARNGTNKKCKEFFECRSVFFLDR
jgi:hypothetical protein